MATLSSLTWTSMILGSMKLMAAATAGVLIAAGLCPLVPVDPLDGVNRNDAAMRRTETEAGDIASLFGPVSTIRL